MSVWPPLQLPVVPPFAPMEATLARALPEGAWQYEPKWDGFRCLAFREGDTVVLQSKNGQPLGRYFPEIVAAVRALPLERAVLDGEIVIPGETGFSFDDLLQRIHPAASRVRRLAEETPGLFLVFDVLVDEAGRSLVERPLRERRAALEDLGRRAFGASVRLTPATEDPGPARGWLSTQVGAGLDGVVAKLLDSPYRSGERDAMVKVKRQRTADCVVGGWRRGAKGGVGSLLLGLYDDEGVLHHVGHCAALREAARASLEQRLVSLAAPPGFTGRAPGGPSRWAQGRSTEWVPVRPVLVCEVAWDHWSGGRFRHGTRFLRWRPEKDPLQCTFDQIEPPRPPAPRGAEPAQP